MPTLSETAAVWGLRVLHAAAILGAGLWAAMFVSNLVRRQALKNPRVDSTVGNFLSVVIRYAIIAVVLIAVLQMFGVQTTSLVAVLGAGALAVGLALQGTLVNAASGILLVLLRPYHIGDFVEINGREGQVTDVDLFFTQIVTLEDRRVFVPNGAAMGNPIVNHTTHGRRRCEIVLGVGYDDDLDKVLAVIAETLSADPRTLKEPPIWAGVVKLGDFAVDVSARAWIRTDDYLQYRADMIHWLKEAFDREEIDLPYPHSVELSKGELTLRLPPVKPPPVLDAPAPDAAPPRPKRRAGRPSAA